VYVLSCSQKWHLWHVGLIQLSIGKNLKVILTTLNFVLCVGVEFELRALHLQSSHSTPCATLQSVLLWLFWYLMNYLPGLVSNHIPSDFSLPNIQDYMHEPPVPSQTFYS
jgi:hypothetical protein